MAALVSSRAGWLAEVLTFRLDKSGLQGRAAGPVVSGVAAGKQPVLGSRIVIAGCGSCKQHRAGWVVCDVR